MEDDHKEHKDFYSEGLESERQHNKPLAKADKRVFNSAIERDKLQPKNTSKMRDFAKKHESERYTVGTRLSEQEKIDRASFLSDAIISKSMLTGDYSKICDPVKEAIQNVPELSKNKEYKQMAMNFTEGMANLEELTEKLGILNEQEKEYINGLKNNLDKMKPEERKVAEELIKLHEDGIQGGLKIDHIIKQHSRDREAALELERMAPEVREPIEGLAQNMNERMTITGKIGEIFKNIAEGIKTGVHKIFDAVKGLFNSIGEHLVAQAGRFGEFVGNLIPAHPINLVRLGFQALDNTPEGRHAFREQANRFQEAVNRQQGVER